jgi:hypothetical protein
MSVAGYVCVYLGMYVGTWVCMYLPKLVCKYPGMCVCSYVPIYIFVYVCTYIHRLTPDTLSGFELVSFSYVNTAPPFRTAGTGLPDGIF